ncbi:ATP-binding protein [Brevundimonas sp. SORGH_AS_0993]|uniref:ATP-binding protein n=1 Tax=Brevundimonas sp. SORGH_AS_0993 TaxID=3041794 RepID=UPI0027D84063|nr:ATP-binding protein [Brevundimonas sp. SORGH_AS_0993]
MVVIATGMGCVLILVSHAINAHQAAKEKTLVQLRLNSALEDIGKDIKSASVWDEAVSRMTADDIGWFDRFLGRYYRSQYHHVATLGYDGAGRLIRSSHGDVQSPPDPADPFALAARPLADVLRREAAVRNRSTAGEAAVRIKAAFVRVDGQVFVLGLSTIVRDLPSGPSPAADPLVASYRAVTQELDFLRTRMAMKDVGFQTGPAKPPQGMAAVDVRDASGALLGRVVWTPERPGYMILTTAGPVLALLLLVLVAGTASLLGNATGDLRRLRASEAALSAALERAEAANQAKSRFLSNISHELRTPLNGVLGMAEVIGADVLTPQQRGRLEILKASGQQQLRMIEELLDVVRLRDGAVALETRPFRPDNLLRRIAADFSGAAEAKGLKIGVQAASGEWLGDPVHIEKLMAALTDNAVRFTRQGQIMLRAVARDHLVLEVQDTGPGMEPAEAARLFDAFTQGDESATRTADGLGLGLTVAHGLAALMGGRIEIVTHPGVGSTFRVALPLQRAS